MIFKEDCQFDTVVIIGRGPLLKEQRELATKHFSIVLAEAVKGFPYANLLFCTGKCTYENNHGFPEFAGDMKLNFGPTNSVDILNVREVRTEEWSPNPGIPMFWDLEYQAFGLALEFKPKKIVLLGYNLPMEYPLFDNEREKDFKRLAEKLERRGVQVYNCSLEGGDPLKCFNKEYAFNVL